MSIELSIIVPTFNERANVEPLIMKLDGVLKGISWEVIFVDDDSPDGTSQHVREVSQADRRVRCIQRISRRGLSSASIEGMLASSAPFLAVMDGDLQHDETLLKKMLKLFQSDDLDLVIGSRYVHGGSTGEWSRQREHMSRLATAIGRKLMRVDIKDPMSGFFMIKRTFLERVVHRLSGKGFKILFDLCVSAPEPVRFVELPFEFKNRIAGESKLSTMVMWEYLLLLVDKWLGPFIPVRFILFVIVGGLGLVVHLLILKAGLHVMNLNFGISQSIAVFTAMTVNFIFNNIFTYRDKKLKGIDFARGLVSFYAACSIGAFVSIRVASFLFDNGIRWWLAGILGAVIGAVWNYAITSTFTWKKKGAL
jgi:dolichol-phosphate mannosyltransferase